MTAACSIRTRALRLGLILTSIALLGACSYWPFAGGKNGDGAAVPVATAQSVPPVASPSFMRERRSARASMPGEGGVVDDGRGSIPLRADAPSRYVVVRGDTLWDISGKFLRDPWFWPEIWQVNPEIENPHLIYPGDVLSLVWVDGRPQLRLERGGTDVLSPQIRVSDLDGAIKTIPYDAIASFLSKPTILSREQIEAAPYIVSIKESHLIAGSGFTVYVRNTTADVGTRYNVMHIGELYRDPETGEKLGWEGLHVGRGRLVRSGEVSSMYLSEAYREALRGDRLLLEEADIPLNFYPHAPKVQIEARIMDVVDGLALIGQFQIVVLNKGRDDGVESGQVLSIWQAGDVVRDHYERHGRWDLLRFSKSVQLPDEHAGRLLVFRALDDISYGLVMTSTLEIHVGDKARNPR